MKLLLLLLKIHGFKWILHGEFIGAVDPETIDIIECSEDCITVNYVKESKLTPTTAKVSKIEFPAPNLLDSCWILVYIEDIDNDEKDPVSLDFPNEFDPIEVGV